MGPHALSGAADTQAMVDALPQGQLAVVERSGHLSALEDPRAFAAAVNGFVQNL